MVCDIPLTGRYVIIQVTGTANLHMTEVEVYSGKKLSEALLLLFGFFWGVGGLQYSPGVQHLSQQNENVADDEYLPFCSRFLCL